ncbi:Uncharacterised protein [Mycobacteroides abscessus subsp. abscessus]|nr:Uncharacterised protein [Mycobacteroides abscessus subsp. abscessus]
MLVESEIINAVIAAHSPASELSDGGNVGRESRQRLLVAHVRVALCRPNLIEVVDHRGGFRGIVDGRTVGQRRRVPPAGVGTRLRPASTCSMAFRISLQLNNFRFCLTSHAVHLHPIFTN